VHVNVVDVECVYDGKQQELMELLQPQGFEFVLKVREPLESR
jgi:hypothetical protein